MKRLYLLPLIIAFGFQSYAQENKDIYLSEILEEALFSGKDTVRFSNINILEESYFENKWTYEISYSDYFMKKYPEKEIEKDTIDRLIVPATIILGDISGDLGLHNIFFNGGLIVDGGNDILSNFSNSIFNSLEINDLENATLMLHQNFILNKLELTGINIEKNRRFAFMMNDVKVKEQISIDVTAHSDEYFYIQSNSFEGDSTNIYMKHHNLNPDELRDSSAIYFNFFNGNTIIRDNKFKQMGVSLEVNANRLEISSNSFTQEFRFITSEISSLAEISNNEFNSIGLGKILFPANLDLDFNQLKGFKLFSLKDVMTNDELNQSNRSFGCVECVPYKAENDQELAQWSSFRRLIGLYSEFYRLNQERGDIQSANDAYYELSELYSRRYAYLHKNDPSLNTWFKWRLNQLLGYYIGYGTDPAKALVISFYIILLFSIFYFFFPSEWDVSSKSKILKNMKLTINKNEPKTFQTLIKAVALLFLSFLNAFTLSMNSFVTLGFGNIPTKGLARYVCIVQGFMGWFLLSLFSVALINQVIF